MTTASPSPRRVRTPRWLDLRLVAGLVLVLVAVAGGAYVVHRADSTRPVWAATRDLAPGSVLTAADLTSERVKIDGSDYVPVATSLVGQTVTRQIDDGELVPRSAVGATASGTEVTVPLDAQNAPTLQRGQRIRLWVSTKTCLAVVLLGDVTVQDVSSGDGGAFGSGSGQSVVVRVPQDLAARVVTALDAPDAVLRAGVLDGQPDPAANSDLPTLATCVAPAG